MPCQVSPPPQKRTTAVALYARPRQQALDEAIGCRIRVAIGQGAETEKAADQDGAAFSKAILQASDRAAMLQDGLAGGRLEALQVEAGARAQTSEFANAASTPVGGSNSPRWRSRGIQRCRWLGSLTITSSRLLRPEEFFAAIDQLRQGRPAVLVPAPPGRLLRSASRRLRQRRSEARKRRHPN